MSKMKIKKSKTQSCTECNAEAGLLLITMPSNRFLRKRTEAEEKWFADLVKIGALTLDHVRHDRRVRRVRLCPKCIAPVRKKFGFDKKGRAIPVGQWAQ